MVLIAVIGWILLGAVQPLLFSPRLCIVQGHDLSDAVDRAWELECSPGGQVRGQPLPAEYHHLIPDHQRDALLDLYAAMGLNSKFLALSPGEVSKSS